MPQTLPNPLAQAGANRHLAAAARIFDAPFPLQLWHLASLDAPTVAVVWALAFAWAAGVRLPAWLPLLLALGAWAVYIADRLLDARAALRTGTLNSLQERHRFHHRHRRLFVPLAVSAACAAAWIVFTLMPFAARERNSVLAVAALAYFTRVHSPARPQPASPPLRFPLFKKELLVGVLFTAACALPAIARAAAEASTPLWPLLAAAVFFALLAWLNCHAIDRWEARGQAPRIAFPAYMLSGAGVLLSLVLCFPAPRAAALILAGAASGLLLALLDRQRSRLTSLALRAAADLVLLTPLALLAK